MYESANGRRHRHRPLTPERIDDFLTFFKRVAHTDKPEWDRCYCVSFTRVDKARQQIDNFFNPDAHREGYDRVECYPEKGEADEFDNIPGHRAMFERLGFHKELEAQKRLVYQIDLI